MKRIVPVLSITGSDCSGSVGVQADVKTIADMGGYPLTAVTAITIQNTQSLIDISYLPAELVLKQVRTVLDDMRPTVAKVGLLGHSDAIVALRNEIIRCKYIVLDPGIISSGGRRLIDDETLIAIRNYLIPETSLLMLKCKEAELILKTPIFSDEDMLDAAQKLHEMGARWVLLRGGNHVQGQLTALLYGQNKKKFFTSYNTSVELCLQQSQLVWEQEMIWSKPSAKHMSIYIAKLFTPYLRKARACDLLTSIISFFLSSPRTIRRLMMCSFMQESYVLLPAIYAK